MILSYITYLLLQIKVMLLSCMKKLYLEIWAIKSPESNPTTQTNVSAHLGSLDFINIRYYVSFQDKIIFALESVMNKSQTSQFSDNNAYVYLFQMKPLLNGFHVRWKPNSNRFGEVSGPVSPMISFLQKILSVSISYPFLFEHTYAVMFETLGVGRWQLSLCLIWKKPSNLRTKEALGVSGERKCNGKLVWNLHWYNKTQKKKSLWVLCVCSSGCISLKRHLSGCAVQHHACAQEWAAGIGPVLKSSVIRMVQVEFLPGEVWEKSAVGVINLSSSHTYFL